MNKYLQVIKITLLEYSVYRLNFILWRFRNVVQLLVLYFLWQAAIPEGTEIFGYDQAKILTYILGTSFIRSFVISSRSVDAAGHISSGDISNFLIKPINYIKYWFAKDAADKLLNLCFSLVEISVIIYFLKPPFTFQTDVSLLMLTFVAILIGVVLYFCLSFLLSTIAFWSPENPWPMRFLFDILVIFFAGSFFPLDILPETIFNFLKLLPFSYLLFFPMDIYLGKLSFNEVIIGMTIALFWVVVCYQLLRVFFKLGLKSYAAWGR